MLKNLDKAIAESIKENGEQIDGYVDPDSLYFSDEYSKKILDSNGDYLWESLYEFYPDESDDYYSDHMETIYTFLKLEEEAQEKHYDEILSALKEQVCIDFNYAEGLDKTKVNMNISINSETSDYVYGWQSLEYKNSTILTYAPDDYNDILKIFGSSLKEYKSWYNGRLRKKRPEEFYNFMKSFNEEIENSGSGFDELVFAVNMTLREALTLKTAKSITIEPNGLCGFLDTWNGGGSLLAIKAMKPTKINMQADNVVSYIDGTNGYGIDQIYGMYSSAWEIGYEIEPGEEDEDE